MLIFSYNLSSTLAAKLKTIDRLRTKILLTPIPVIWEQQLVWQATLSHITGWANLSNQPFNPKALEKLLTGPGANRPLSSFEKKALDYRRALNFLWLEWTANPKAVTASDLRHLADILGVSFRREDEVTSLLGYIQTGNVNPVVQSAITHLYFYPSRLSYLSSLLILYKAGLDFRRMVSLEDYWNNHKPDYLQVLTNATKLGNVTLWLEYFCQALITQLEKLDKSLNPPAGQTPPFRLLSARQKSILTFLDQPGSTISNKLVQKEFGISQITASRDLAKLTSLNFIIPHGRGRSTSYSKA